MGEVPAGIAQLRALVLEVEGGTMSKIRMLSLGLLAVFIAGTAAIPHAFAQSSSREDNRRTLGAACHHRSNLGYADRERERDAAGLLP
jgi:hypothetical protein